MQQHFAASLCPQSRAAVRAAITAFGLQSTNRVCVMNEKDFDFQPTLLGYPLKIEPLREDHFELLYKAASDPEIWAGHPSADRYKRELFTPYFAGLLASGKALVFNDLESNKIIGTSSFYVPPDHPDGIAIGFTFLIKERWGGATNRQLKHLMLEHAFKKYGTIYFHIAPTNIRSQKATMKLGAKFLYDAELKLSDSATLWKCYGIEKAGMHLAACAVAD